MNSIVVAPTFLRSSCAVGQIERHFFPNLPGGYFSHIFCAKDDLDLKGSNFQTHVIPENKFAVKVDLLCRKTSWRDLVISPDVTHYSWCGRAHKEIASLLKKEKIDYIHTVNNPVSAHLLGYKVKNEFGLPWVAQFYDPWHNNPFRRYSCGYFDRKDAERERMVAENADLIIFPNEELLDSWVQIYGDTVKNKVEVLPFVTELPAIKEKKRDSDTLTISHIGTLSKERRADVFLKAISKLNKCNPDLAARLKVNIVGFLTDSDKECIARENIGGIVDVKGHLSEEECFKYYEDSDVFLIIDIDCEPNLFYPSKLIKYFCSRKPILGITKPNSVVANELQKSGNHVCAYDDVEGIYSFLVRAISDYESINHNDKEYGDRFSPGNVVAGFERLIKKYIYD